MTAAAAEATSTAADGAPSFSSSLVPAAAPVPKRVHMKTVDPMPPLLSKLTRREVSGQVAQRLAFLWRLLFKLPANLTAQRLQLSRSFVSICAENAIALPGEVDVAVGGRQHHHQRFFCPHCSAFLPCPGASHCRLRPVAGGAAKGTNSRMRETLRRCKNQLVVTCLVCGGAAATERACVRRQVTDRPLVSPSPGKSLLLQLPRDARLPSLATPSAAATAASARTPGGRPSSSSSLPWSPAGATAPSSAAATPKNRFSFLDKLDQQAITASSSSSFATKTPTSTAPNRGPSGLGSGDFIPLGSSSNNTGGTSGQKRPLSAISGPSPPPSSSSSSSSSPSLSLDALEKAMKKQRKQQQQPGIVSPPAFRFSAPAGPKPPPPPVSSSSSSSRAQQPSQKSASLGSIKTFLNNK